MNTKSDRTREEIEIVQKIINSNNDYYRILGVSKHATMQQIKLAYKKLAKLVHPDKNKCPEATEAFKAVSRANEVLSDDIKRRYYDFFGGTKSNSFWEFSKEGEKTQSAPHNTHRPKQDNEEQSSKYRNDNTENDNYKTKNTEFYVILVVLVIITSLVTLYLGTGNPYSLQRKAEYNIRRTTVNLGVPYFVKGNFYEEFYSKKLILKLEKSIEENFVSNLRHSCNEEISNRDWMLQKARDLADRTLFKKAHYFKMASCNKLQSFVLD